MKNYIGMYIPDWRGPQWGIHDVRGKELENISWAYLVLGEKFDVDLSLLSWKVQVLVNRLIRKSPVATNVELENYIKFLDRALIPVQMLSRDGDSGT